MHFQIGSFYLIRGRNRLLDWLSFVELSSLLGHHCLSDWLFKQFVNFLELITNLYLVLVVLHDVQDDLLDDHDCEEIH